MYISQFPSARKPHNSRRPQYNLYRPLRSVYIKRKRTPSIYSLTAGWIHWNHEHHLLSLLSSCDAQLWCVAFMIVYKIYISKSCFELGHIWPKRCTSHSIPVRGRCSRGKKFPNLYPEKEKKNTHLKARKWKTKSATRKGLAGSDPFWTQR